MLTFTSRTHCLKGSLLWSQSGTWKILILYWSISFKIYGNKCNTSQIADLVVVVVIGSHVLKISIWYSFWNIQVGFPRFSVHVNSHLGFHIACLFWSEGVCFSQHRHNVDLLIQGLHEVHIYWFETETAQRASVNWLQSICLWLLKSCVEKMSYPWPWGEMKYKQQCTLLSLMFLRFSPISSLRYFSICWST